MNASKKQRDELLDFIRHLAEDDKEGVMATKVGTALTSMLSSKLLTVWPHSYSCLVSKCE